MYNLKLFFLVILCISVDFAQSENLPYRVFPKYSEINDSLISQEKISSGMLKILSYNTWGLPIALSGHDHDRRFDLLPGSISETKSDIIALQETFNNNLRHKLLSILPRNYYTYSDYRCSRNIIPFVDMDCHGGLMTLSAFPIQKEEFFVYPINKSYSIIEKIGQKGFLVSQIKHGKQDLLVVNTHLYAGNDKNSEEIRVQQIKYLHTILSGFELYKIGRVIFLGDFNIQHPDVACSKVYDYIVGTMGFIDSKPNIDDKDYTIDKETNKYVSSKEPGSKLDYIFMKTNSVKPITVLTQSRTMTSDQTLSDHYAWQAFLKI